MSLDLLREKGVPIEQQAFSWRELAGAPFSKLDDDAFTRVRVILMNGIEAQQLRTLHAFARSNYDLRAPLARVRRVEQHQQTLVSWLNPPDQSPLETTIGFEQVAVEITAAVAQSEPDGYLAQVYRFGLLEDFDHLYRFSALLDRVEGKDANNILQSYTDIRPGRPTAAEHRAPLDDLREPYGLDGDVRSKLNALTITAAEHMTHDYYMTIGPEFADPIARQLYAEIASVEEQHVTQYESLQNPEETMLEKWLLLEANEVWNYWSCAHSESNPRIRAIWERFVDYELGHLHMVRQLFKKIEGRDPAEVLPKTLAKPLPHRSQRDFVRQVLKREESYTAVGSDIGMLRESTATKSYRKRLNSDGSPSEVVAAGYRWSPGTELTQKLQVASPPRQRRKEARPS